jgi:hypothetical protein
MGFITEHCFIKPVTKQYCRNKYFRLNALSIFFFERTRRVCCRFFSNRESVWNMFTSWRIVDFGKDKTFRNRLIHFLPHLLHDLFFMYFSTITIFYVGVHFIFTNNLFLLRSCRQENKDFGWCVVRECVVIRLPEMSLTQADKLATCVGLPLNSIPCTFHDSFQMNPW